MFSTEGKSPKVTLPEITSESNTNNILLATPSQATPSQATDSEKYEANALEELIASDTSVSIPYNGRSEFIEIIAKINDDTYVDVTSVVDWESENNDIAYAYKMAEF